MLLSRQPCLERELNAQLPTALVALLQVRIHLPPDVGGDLLVEVGTEET
jgi:hypothetical protein